jgi:hypothetical protein
MCPACESTPALPPYEFVSKQLQQFETADETARKFGQAWKLALCAGRLQKLETRLSTPGTLSENMHVKINANLAAGQGTVDDLNAVTNRLAKLDEARTSEIAQLKANKAVIEAAPPPSLVTLIEQVERAKRVKNALTQTATLASTITEANRKLTERRRWKTFIDDACETFEKAEA